MKILIADSGSTKTQWALIADESAQTLLTSGINPVHMQGDEIEAILKREFTLPIEGIGAVWFYGAGCIPAKCSGVTEVLHRFFGTEIVSVESDLLGAARGILGNQPGVACILGTGSNSALYDGKQIINNVPPLGYILGDEASGANLGKRLIGNLLKGLLSTELEQAFYAEYPLEYAEIIETVYRKPGANRFLAGFCPFICKHINHPAIRSMIEQAFVDFVERNLLQYQGIKELPVSFTGSVAYYFENPLQDVLEKFGLTVGKIEQSPMPGLIRYHQTKIQEP